MNNLVTENKNIVFIVYILDMITKLLTLLLMFLINRYEMRPVLRTKLLTMNGPS